MATDPPKRRKDEAEPPAEAPQPEAKKGGLGGLLLWVGYCVLSTAVIVAVVLLIVQKRRHQAPPPIDAAATTQVVDSLAAQGPAAADSLAAAGTAGGDSLARVDPQDSLKSRIEDLQVAARQHDDSLNRALEATARLKTRLEKLQIELDTMIQRDVVLSSEEVARLSRVFGSMQPLKAAPVLARMDNASVAAILLMIEERTAAKILAAMSPDRAAGISTLIREQAKQKARRVKAGG